MRMLMVTLGYKKYVGAEKDILKLISIAMRLHQVDGGGYNTPYKLDEDQEPFVSGAEIVNVSFDPLPAHAGDIACSALRGILALEADVGVPRSEAGKVAARALLHIAGARLGVVDKPQPAASDDAERLVPF